MATAVNLHRFVTVHSLPAQTRTTRPRRYLRLRSQKKETSSLETTVDEPVSPALPPKPVPPPASSTSALIANLRELFKFDELGRDIISIALPAALALAADPITALVDTAFVGHIGSAELAAVGVSVSVFNLVSKLVNVPLLNVTTSFVAEEQVLASKSTGTRLLILDVSLNALLRVLDPTFVLVMTVSVDFCVEDVASECQDRKVLPSVSTSLALAAGVGIAEAVALYVGSGFLMNIMGIPVDSPMREPAKQFLSVRAFGAPPIVVALAAQGAFRGFKDTRTPLYAVVAGNLLNAILDPVLIFQFGFGIGGAAVATVISEYLIAFILLWKLNDKVELISPEIDGARFLRYLNSGGLLIGRTIAVLLTMTLSTSLAAKEGSISMAGHQICMQVWLSVSLLNDALALAGQALLANGYTEGNYKQARKVIYRTLQIGLFTGVVLAVVLSVGFGAFSSLFTSDTDVLKIAWSGIWFVAGSQPMNALAFVIDGLYYGVSDFGYAAYSMIIVGVISSAFLLIATPVYGLGGVWAGLFLFMTLRVTAGIWRLGTRSGPWEMVWAETEQEND